MEFSKINLSNDSIKNINLTSNVKQVEKQQVKQQVEQKVEQQVEQKVEQQIEQQVKQQEENISGTIDISKLNFEFDRYFLNWLKQNKVGIVICSYKSNAIFSMGTAPNTKSGQDMLSLWITNSMRPMGACYDSSRKNLWVGNSLQLWQYHNQGRKETDRETMPDFDSHFMPRTMRTINDIDIHDVCVDNDGNPFFVSALFCCVCKPSDKGSFEVVWCPPWLSKVATEDRCHLNGLAMREGVPRYVSSVSRADIRGGWREHKTDGGIIWDIVENKLVKKKKPKIVKIKAKNIIVKCK